jgi:PAS domain S-box-containing protein
MPLKTSKNIIVGIGLTIVAALFSVVISLQQSKKINDTNIAIENTRQVLMSNQQLLVYSLEIETAGRGFLLIGTTSFVDSVFKKIQLVEKELQQLKLLTAESPTQQQKVAQINQYIVVRINSTLDHINAKKAGDNEKLQLLLQQGIGAAAMNKIQYLSSQLKDEQYRDLNQRKAANAEAYERLKNIYYLTLGIIFISLVILGIRIIEDNIQRKKNIQQLEIYNDRLEKEVKEKTAEIQSVFERVSDAFVALDVNWCYTYTNSKADEIFGKPPGYLKGKHIWTEFPEGVDKPFYFAYYRAMKTQQYEHIEEYYEPYDKWFENHIYPSPSGLSIYFRDITEKKKTEQNIKATNERFELITKATNDVIWDWDVKHDVMWWNDNFYSSFGYDRFSVAKGIQSWSDNLFEEDKATTIASLYEAIQNKQIFWQSEYRFIKADGSIVKLYDRGFSLLNE